LHEESSPITLALETLLFCL